MEAKYTTEGRLIGHILMGRDIVREAASRIDGFPEELLLLLEHAILAHDGSLIRLPGSTSDSGSPDRFVYR